MEKLTHWLNEGVRFLFDRHTQTLRPYTYKSSKPDTDEYRIAKLELKAGDVVVIKLDRHLSLEEVVNIRQQIEPLLPDGVKAMVLDCEGAVSILTVEEIERRTKALLQEGYIRKGGTNSNPHSQVQSRPPAPAPLR